MQNNNTLRMLLCLLALAACSHPMQPESIDVFFTPGDDAASKIIEVITEAQSTILVAQYDFKYMDIAKALVKAKKRGVKVKLLGDPYSISASQPKQLRALDLLARHDIKVRVALAESNGGDIWEMHNKYMVIDDKTVQMGSGNFTAGAFKANYENFVIIRGNPGLAHQFKDNFYLFWTPAKPYRP